MTVLNQFLFKLSNNFKIFIYVSPFETILAHDFIYFFPISTLVLEPHTDYEVVGTPNSYTLPAII